MKIRVGLVFVLLAVLVVLAVGKYVCGRSYKENNGGATTPRVKVDDSFGNYAVPYVIFERGECCVPRTWNPEVSSTVDYRYLEADSIFHEIWMTTSNGMPTSLSDNKTEDPKFCLINGAFDKAIENATQYMILPNGPQELAEAENPIRAEVYRRGMSICALALELMGDWEKASNVYNALYDTTSDDMKWILARKNYAQYLTSSEDIAVSQYAAGFEELCDLILKYSAMIAVDDIEKKVKDFDERASVVPCTKLKSQYEEAYEQVRELYLFRDRCARIVNPRLHYMCGNNTRQLMMLSRKSFEVFIEEIENYCRQYNDSERASRSEPVDKAKRALVFLKRVNEIPY